MDLHKHIDDLITTLENSTTKAERLISANAKSIVMLRGALRAFDSGDIDTASAQISRVSEEMKKI